VRWTLALILVPGALGLGFAQDAAKPRNAIIFVAHGLRHDSVNPRDTPAFYRIRTEGVSFANGHAVFPTQTMPNAASIATGHLPGDTGQFANHLFVGYPLFDTGNFGRARGTLVPAVEEGFVLADINDHYGGNYLREASLLAYARSYGYNTATVGKTGPAALQDLADVSVIRRAPRDPGTIILESATGTPGGIPLTATTMALLKSAGLRPQPPPTAGNAGHQQWFADVVTKAILPAFGKSAEPFVLVFWSDEGPTPGAAIRNADRSLKQILDYLDAHADVRDITNIFVTADHGISTVSGQEMDLALDLAHEFGLPLYDPEVQVTDERGVKRYASPRRSKATALIGGTGKIERPTDAKLIVAQTSIHLPDNNRGTVQRTVRFLATRDHIGGIFVNDRFGPMAGALQLSDVGLLGRATTPKPAVVVNFDDAFSRTNTFINMAAMGPDFKKGFVARAPAGNADIQPTLAHILKMNIPSLGKLRGRVLSEALAGGPQTTRFSSAVARSRPSQRGESTVLMYQRVGGYRYTDQACFTREKTCTVR
jgi:arylsulfatase A-like enzyme